METGGNVAAELVERGRRDRRVKLFGFELVEGYAGPLRQVTVGDAIDLGEPLPIAGQGWFAFGVAPAGRLAHDRPIDLRLSFHEPREGGLRCEHAAVEEMLLNAVGAPQFELGVGPQLLEDVLRTALEQTAAIDRIARGVRPGAVLVHVQQRVLGIVGDEAETAQAVGVPEPVPIVWGAVAEEVGNRRVEVAPVENDQHVVDEIIHVQQHFVGGIARSVGIVALRPLIRGGGGESVDRHLPKAGPGVHRAVGRVNAVTVVGSDLDDVVLVFGAAEIGGCERSFRPFGGVE